MFEVCGDNRFEVIEKAKSHLMEATNIETSEDEMKVLSSFLFRCWQMGWLKQYDDTIEAEPVRHGRWVRLSYGCYADGRPVYDEWECAECHFRCNGEGEPQLNYCPNCGAKMEVKNEDGID